MSEPQTPEDPPKSGTPSTRSRELRRAVLWSVALTFVFGGITILFVDRGLLRQLTAKTEPAKTARDSGPLVGIRKAVRQRLDCSKSVYGTPCGPGHYLPPRDRTGRPLGRERDGVSWQLGVWTIRATCNLEHLMIEAARNDSGATNTKLEYQTLFDDPTDPARCGSYFSITKRRCPNGVGCNWRDFDHALQVGALTEAGTDQCGFVPNARHFRGTVLCPSGSYLVSGGADCQVPPSGGILLTSRPIQDANTSRPIGWYADCCASAGSPSYAQGLFALCRML